MNTLPEANTEFAFDAFREFLQASPNGNALFSPLNISSALAMLLLGGRGDTAEQLRKVGIYSLSATKPH